MGEYDFAGARNSQDNVSDVIPVSNRVITVVGAVEQLIESPDPVNFRRVVLNAEKADESFRVRLGDYVRRGFFDADIAGARMVAGTDVTFDATLDTATRVAGSWLTDGFLDGQVITVQDSAATLTGAPGVIIDAGDNDFTRDAGDWEDDGFAVGTVFTVGGSANNNGDLTVTSVNSTTLEVASITMSEATQTDLTMVQTTNNDGPLTIVGDPTATVLQFVAASVTVDTGPSILMTIFHTLDQVEVFSHGYTTGDGPYKINAGEAAMNSGEEVTITNTPEVLTRSAGSWFDDGFVVGMTITIAGSSMNEGQEVILSLTATVLETVGSLDAEGAQTDLIITAPSLGLPGGIGAEDQLWIRVIDDDNIEFHTTRVNALNADRDLTSPPPPVNITTFEGGGQHLIGGMLPGELGAEDPLASVDGYASFRIHPDDGPKVYSAAPCITVIGFDTTSVLTVWWTP